jgi:phosphatidylserine/phosphatidylglycerophosphate/cardiolipin synthase-like enzyme
MKRTINIEKASVTKDRPYTIKLEGNMGHSIFKAELRGVNLEIITPTPLSVKQVSDTEEQLQNIFPTTLDGKFTRKYLNDIMKAHNGHIQIEV